MPSPAHSASQRLALLCSAILLFGQPVWSDDTPAVQDAPKAEKPANPETPAAGAIELEFAVDSVEHLRETKYLLRAAVRNSGQIDAEGPIRVVFLGASAEGFTLARPDGQTEAGEPYVEFVKPRRDLEPDQASRPRAVLFELEAELAEADLDNLEFDYRLECPGLEKAARQTTTRGGKAEGEGDNDDPNADPDADRRNPEGRDGDNARDGERGAGRSASSRTRRPGDGRNPTEGDRPYDPDRDPRDRDGDGDRDSDDEDELDPSEVFGTAISQDRGQPVTVAYVKLHSTADTLPETIGGRRVKPEVTWAFDATPVAGKGGGPVDNGAGMLGQKVLGVSAANPRATPRPGVVVAHGFDGRVRALGREQRVSGVLVVKGTNAPFSSRRDGGMVVLDSNGRQVGVVVAQNGTYTLVGAPEPPKKRRVLFVGNSYTFQNELPNLVAKVARAAGVEIEVESSTGGGMTLRQHVDKGEAFGRIREGNFDVVVLQEQSLTPLFNPRGMLEAATELHAEITKAGSSTLFFMTWARQGKPSMTKGLAASYEGIAAKLGADVAPVGHAWHDVIQNSGLGLHVDDGSHPNQTGSLLAAFVFAGKLLDVDPRTIPGNFGVNAGQAAVLKTAAWSAIRGKKGTDQTVEK